MSKDKYAPEVRAHQEWLGFVQPVGLVVSMPALSRAQCHVQKNVIAQQEALRATAVVSAENKEPRVAELSKLVREVLDWNDEDLLPAGDAHHTVLTAHNDVISADFMVGDREKPTALVMLVDPGLDLDTVRTDTGWEASSEARIERLLRDTNIPIGLLFNQRALRLVYAPRGESSGHITFVIGDMLSVAGRPILGGLVALLSADTVFNQPELRRLPKILSASRDHQSEVSTRLSEQVLGALHTLVRGFQSANDATDGRLLSEVLRESPSDVYGGLLSTLLRLVFVLYAEDRGLVSASPVYARHYSVGALFEKLDEDAARYPDTMDQRYGAWSRLLTLFRLIHDGVGHGDFRLPARHGELFDPDVYPFLEGRSDRTGRQVGAKLAPPRVSDGVVHRVLSALLMLDGDRLSYRTLDVEQIGSVYEAMMGFQLVTVREPSIALSGKRKKGAPPADPVIGLETLLAAKGAERVTLLKERADVELSAKPANELKAAKSIDELLAALGAKISPRSPGVLRAGYMALQPTEERRRSGSHYTPRLLTEPIVEKTLQPVLEAFGASPTPAQILGLKVCDPAMGSGAFLVAACRSLGRVLLAAWQKHGMPAIPADEDPELFARRTIAQRCLYGVDKNPFAVQLAKLSLWLVTLAKDHPFTFLDHALRCGDSLVGLSVEQIKAFHWAPEEQVSLLKVAVDAHLVRAAELRAEIHELSASDDTRRKQELLAAAEDSIEVVRRVGDLVIEAFFSAEKPKARLMALAEMRDRVLGSVRDAPVSEEARRLRAFHWEVEFPEVFGRENPGFDAFVGNPPFSGKNGIAQLHDCYLDWLKALHEEAHGNADLVAHFFRRTFNLVRRGGTLGLIATNTIAQGDTRSSGLRWIVQHGGVIFEARRRYKWPAGAAVIVSVVHISKAPVSAVSARLDGKDVPRISAFLFHTGPDDDPVQLAANANKSFVGSYVLGMGFTFDDSNDEATPIAEMERLIEKDPRNRERIFPYLGGEELNSSPTHAHHRYVINFAQMSEMQAGRWPDLLAIVERKVRGRRGKHSTAEWWHFERLRPELYETVQGMRRVIAVARVSQGALFTFVAAPKVFSEQLIVFASDKCAFQAVLQSRIHDRWARFLGSSMKDDLRYTPTDCFETFPFPANWQSNATLESAGQTYYDFRAVLMVRNNQGLTTTYNRFHDPEERDADILKLRELHAAMDRAVLDAYGWTDLQPTCAFLLDYEDEEDDEDEDSTRRRKKKPYRYRWPDDTRDEVLARLLALNAERAAEERRHGLEASLKPAEDDSDEDASTAKSPAKKPPKKRATKKAKN
jgi:hypothetical protein